MTDKNDLNRLVDGCKKGRPDCFSQLVDIYASRCYAYFYRLTGDTAASDDLLSELFLKLVEKIASFKGRSFEAWLFRVASNVFYDFLRENCAGKKCCKAEKTNSRTKKR